MLVEGIIHYKNVYYKLLFIICITAFIVFIIDKLIKNTLNKLFFVFLINYISLFYDIISGQNMLKFSILSYDPIIGARYYGLGNEFLGVMVGGSLLLSSIILEKDNSFSKTVFASLCFTITLIGLPWMGSNVGGLITAAVSFLIFILLEYGYSLKKAVRISILISITMLLFITAINILFKDAESHLGRMVQQIQDTGLLYLYNITARKLAMAVKLIRYTVWSRVMMVLIAVAIIILVKPRSCLTSLFSSMTHIKNSWTASLIGCFIAILSNDSGIVTAAFIMLFTVISLILILDPIS
jgi:hypothetical protein